MRLPGEIGATSTRGEGTAPVRVAGRRLRTRDRSTRNRKRIERGERALERALRDIELESEARDVGTAGGTEAR